MESTSENAGQEEKTFLDMLLMCVLVFFLSFLVAFEELERALGTAQRAEEARKQLQVQLEEQVKDVVRASEEERKSLQQELTRVKHEVVTIMKVRK